MSAQSLRGGSARMISGRQSRSWRRLLRVPGEDGDARENDQSGPGYAVIDITLPEARERMALRPNRGSARSPLPVALPVGQITHGLVQCCAQKYSASRLPQITPTNQPSRAHERGVSRSSRTLVRDAMDAAVSGASGGCRAGFGL
jgi:hypothetical protein